LVRATKEGKRSGSNSTSVYLNRLQKKFLPSRKHAEQF